MVKAMTLLFPKQNILFLFNKQRLDSQTPSSQMPKNQIISPATSTPTIPLIRTRRLSVLMSPSRMNNKRVSTPIALASGNSDESSGGQLLCDVCHTIGTNTDLVE